MALPANIRVNVAVPFPAMVQGSGPVTLTKVNGVWTIGMSADQLASVLPPSQNFPTDFIPFWDSIAKVWSKLSLFNLSLSTIAVSTSHFQRSVTASPIVLLPTDQMLNVNISSGSPTCPLPTAVSRGGAAFIFKDVGANFAAHPLTITPAGGDTIDGAASLVLNVNRQGVTLNPFNDGVNTGWFVT